MGNADTLSCRGRRGVGQKGCGRGAHTVTCQVTFHNGLLPAGGEAEGAVGGGAGSPAPPAPSGPSLAWQ